MEKAKKEANQLLEDSKQEIDLVVEDLKKQAVLKQHVVIDDKRNLDLLKHEEKKIVNETNHVYQVGDIVKVLSANRQGEILSINRKGILTIDMSGLKLNAKPEEVSFISKKVKPKKVKSSLWNKIKNTTMFSIFFLLLLSVTSSPSFFPKRFLNLSLNIVLLLS